MNIYDYQQAFAADDKTSKAMRRAVEDWFSAYYAEDKNRDADPSQRIAYTVVNKIMKAVFSEYKSQTEDPATQAVLQQLEEQKKAAVQLALVGGECFIKPCPNPDGFRFTLIPRNRILIFGRDAAGEPTDVGTAQRITRGNDYYTLLERRSLDETGHLTIQNRLYRSKNAQNLGSQVPLQAVEEFGDLADVYRYPQKLPGVGLVRMKTPMLNCVDGSEDGVAVYAAAMGLIRNIDENEAQMNGEFARGESRILASADLLDKDNALTDHLFVGLDEDPEQVGITVFSPTLREASFLARKQEYLRNVESIIGMRRGMLSDANIQDRTATEIASSAGDFNLTVMEFQAMWETAMRKVLRLCRELAKLYRLPAMANTAVTVDWGNSTLYDEDRIWQDYKDMVSAGLIAPEVALGWRFNLPCENDAQRRSIREKWMPQ